MLVEDLREKMRCCEDEEPLSFYLQRPDGSEEELTFKHVGSSAGGRVSFLVFTLKGLAKAAPVPHLVTVANYHGWNWSPLQLFGYGPLWAFTCGHCAATFQQRITIIDSPTVECPKCHVLNIVPIKIEQ